MTYELKKVALEFNNSLEKSGIMKKKIAEDLGVSRQTLDVYLKEGEMPLSKFYQLCDILKINPVVFFDGNSGNIQNAVNNRGVTQTISNSSVDYELLKQENKHLKEKVELLERLLKTYQN